MLWLRGGHPSCTATSTSLLLAWLPQLPAVMHAGGQGLKDKPWALGVLGGHCPWW